MKLCTGSSLFYTSARGALFSHVGCGARANMGHVQGRHPHRTQNSWPCYRPCLPACLAARPPARRLAGSVGSAATESHRAPWHQWWRRRAAPALNHAPAGSPARALPCGLPGCSLCSAGHPGRLPLGLPLSCVAVPGPWKQHPPSVAFPTWPHLAPLRDVRACERIYLRALAAQRRRMLSRTLLRPNPPSSATLPICPSFPPPNPGQTRPPTPGGPTSTPPAPSLEDARRPMR